MKKIKIILISICIFIALCACGTQSFSADNGEKDFDSLKCTKEWNLSYASLFSVKEYDDYVYVSLNNGDNWLIVPENEVVPDNLPENTIVLQKPLDNVYLVSSSVMDMIAEIEAIDNIKMTGTKEEDWNIEKAKAAINAGTLLYAGKYNQPDYEMILSNDCDLAIENTMILHNPESKEKLEELGIPVVIELSSYEEHPLGRLEWIKLFGIMFDKYDEAEKLFDKQVETVCRYDNQEKTDKTVAFFYMTSNGVINVKKPKDYVPKMIGIAGGKYVPETIEGLEENALSAVNLQFEEFYEKAKDADIIIYNSTTVSDVNSIADLIGKSELFSDFKAVKENRVYISGANFFQKTTGVSDVIEDMSRIINGESEDELHFFKHIY